MVITLLEYFYRLKEKLEIERGKDKVEALEKLLIEDNKKFIEHRKAIKELSWPRKKDKI